MNYAHEIKQRVTMVDCALKYGFHPNRAGFICCPFHNEKTASMKVYNGDRGFCCFGCGERGDVIFFVQKLFSLSFYDALRKIDADFCLNLFGRKSFEDFRRLHRKEQAIDARREREKRERAIIEKECEDAFFWWKICDDSIRNHKPKEQDLSKLHPMYIFATKNIERAKYRLDCAEIRRFEHERLRNSNNGN